MDAIAIPTALAELARVYEAAGHEIWLVGGVVRDHILGLPSKDVDLATSATPEEQVELANAAGYRWFATGLQHGTLTILAGDEPYEITTFRTDVETDGRHATVAYTRDLATDLARRDLTMNAIAMSVTDGRVVDPFDGVKDVLERRVRFVGDAGERMREDYLRIMRWFRFVGRFAENLDFSLDDVDAISANAAGLSRISVERVWSEMQRILAGPRPYGIVQLMGDTGVLDVLGVPRGDLERLADMRPHSNDPALLLAAWLGDDAPEVSRRWKTSTAEQEAVAFMAARIGIRYEIEDAKADLVAGVEPRRVDVLLRTRDKGHIIKAMMHWETPTFPVQGRDLTAAGMKPGPAMGETLRSLKAAWAASDYTLTFDQLMASVEITADA
jgi:poly(A) polymerase